MHSYLKLSLLATSLLGLAACSDSAAKSSPNTAASAQRTLQVVELADPHRLQPFSFTGKLQSAESANVAFRVPGTIVEILVRPGDQIKQGQVLARLDPHDYQVLLAEFEAKSLEAESAHKLAKAELARVQQAIDDKAISDVSLDRAISGYERSKSAVAVVAQNIRRAQDTLSYTELKAPFDGVIAQQHVDAFEQALPGMAAFTVHQPNHLEVAVDVPENLIHEFQLDQTAQVSWYKAPHALNAQATEIGSLPHPIKQTYSVTFSLAPSAEQVQALSILPGKAVTVATQFTQQAIQHCVPYSAIVESHGQQHVFVVDNNQAKQVPVTVSSLDSNKACVEAKLAPGDYVVVSGAAYLEDAQAIHSIQIKTL